MGGIQNGILKKFDGLHVKPEQQLPKLGGEQRSQIDRHPPPPPPPPLTGGKVQVDMVMLPGLLFIKKSHSALVFAGTKVGGPLELFATSRQVPHSST